jgi:aspartyl/asparaginyl-tRNA synthetase
VLHPARARPTLAQAIHGFFDEKGFFWVNSPIITASDTEGAGVHMDYGEAIRMLERANEKFEFPVKWGIDLPSERERYLTEKYAKKPVIVMNYPKAIKAFYMRMNDDGRTVAAMDVLAPGPGIGEIIGGSQREERLDVLDRSMAERGIDREHYAWYRDLRRYGTVPHAGFGLAPAFAGGTLALRDRARQRARRDPLPANARKRAVLTRTTTAPGSQRTIEAGIWTSLNSICAQTRVAPSHATRRVH